MTESTETETSGDSFFLNPDMSDDDNKIDYKVLLTNARSLAPKINSLQTFFDEHNVDIALITESWLQDGEILDRDVIDLEHGSELKVVYKNRPRKNCGARKVGGGVSIIYNKTRCNFKERKIKGNCYEMVAALGKIGKIARPVAVICVYIQPKMKADELEKLRKMIADEILQLKSSLPDPIIIVGGDINRRDMWPAFENYADMRRDNFDGTRGGVCLDIMHSNMSNCNNSTWPPLETIDGVRSYHNCVLFCAAEPSTREFKWQTRTARKHTEAGCRAFIRDFRRVDWNEQLHCKLGPDEMVDRFEVIIKGLTDRHFPLFTYRARDNEAPWITHGVRKVHKQKCRVYKREGKSRLWWQLQERGDRLIADSKRKFVDKAQSGGGTRGYYAATKAISSRTKPKDWSVMDIFPDLTEEEAGSRVVDYFTEITDTFDPLIPTYGPCLARKPVSLAEVQKKLKEAKKPNSAVEGDVLPRLVKRYHRDIAVTAQKKFNAVFSITKWPAKWKVETAVIIPKGNNPASLSECRNISCTSFLSKVLESILLEDIRNELKIDDIQYGGIKNYSVDHLLVDLHDKILAPLDKGNPVIVLGIDYEKAFSRLNHHECISQLEKLGASAASIALVKSFLTDRQLRAKVGGIISHCKSLCGGSPQGSILGCLLYCITTQQIGPNLIVPDHPLAAVDEHDPPDRRVLSPVPRGLEEGRRVPPAGVEPLAVDNNPNTPPPPGLNAGRVDPPAGVDPRTTPDRAESGNPITMDLINSIFPDLESSQDDLPLSGDELEEVGGILDGTLNLKILDRKDMTAHWNRF